MFKVITLAVAVAAVTGIAGAQATPGTYKSTAKASTKTSVAKSHKTMKKIESQVALRREAKITEAAARAIVRTEIPNGTIKKSELEREHGTLIYSFDISVPGKPGFEELAVSAIDGSIVAREHETSAMEKKEAAREAKAKK